MPRPKGAFLLIDYTGRVKETGKVFDTTSEDEAKKHEIRRPGGTFEPQLVVVGEGWVVKGLDEALMEMEAGVKTTIEVPPEKGLGQRDPTKMRLIPLRRFKARDVTPQPGMEVEVDGRPAIVRTIGAGRVQVDFNPQLAGKVLSYEVTINSNIERTEEKIRALVHRRIPTMPMEKFEVQLEAGIVKITIPQEAFLTEGLQYAKRGIASDIERFITEVEQVTFTETFMRQKPETKEQKTPPQFSETTQPPIEAETQPAATSKPKPTESTPTPKVEEQPASPPRRRKSTPGTKRSPTST